jgi:hypothetical protein
MDLAFTHGQQGETLLTAENLNFNLSKAFFKLRLQVIKAIILIREYAFAIIKCHQSLRHPTSGHIPTQENQIA